ncbi:nucleoside hydrolase [Paenibacillus sp. RC67]|uniref:nucleoside hydrolase n=1 Tax=Paenibacillus sp. RC67 TaxID=3039392 RepID=UPI0024AE4094|nr:nucleoside hydrolase [Paenibacillus sp. RC67]
MKTTWMPYDVPKGKQIRVIMNTDANNEADDQFAIVHALLTPRFQMKGIIAAHFGTNRSKESMLESFRECEYILSLLGEAGRVPLLKGATVALRDEKTPVLSEGAQLIIDEALSGDSAPLYVVFLGPLTDLASAYLAEPSIADKMTALWIGGGKWPEGEREFNLLNDIHAANVVFESPIPLWQVPRNVYGKIRVSLAELALKVKPCGEIGEYLFTQLIQLNDKLGDSGGKFPKGEMWALGDSPAVSLLIDEQPYDYELKPAPRITSDMHYVHYQKERVIRVYHDVDARFTLEDMYAKLALFASGKEQ